MTEYFREVDADSDLVTDGTFFIDKPVKPGSSFFSCNFIVTAEGTFDLQNSENNDEEYFEQP